MTSQRGSRATRLYAAAFAVFAMCGVSAPALAATESFQPVGVKIGEGRLHPFLDAEGRFDSLTGYFSGSAGMAAPTADFIITPRLGVRFDLATSSTVVGFLGSAEFPIYLGVFEAASRNLTRFQANVGVNAEFNKDGAVEVQVGDTMTRSDRTQNPIAGVGLQSLYNEVHLAVPIHPGGKALEFTPRVGWAVEFFEPLLTGSVTGCPNTNDITCNPSLVNRMNYSTLSFALNARWKFLPKTAIVWNNDFSYRTYWVDQATNRLAGLLRSQLGIQGLITPRISIGLTAGYGGELTGQNVHTFIMQAEFAYIPTEIIRLSLGYVRTMVPTAVFGVYGDDRGYVGANIGLMKGRLNLAVNGSVDYLSFYGNAGRNDLIFGISAGPTFDVASWFQIAAGYQLSTRAVFGSAYMGLQSVNFARHEAFLRFTLRY